METGADPSRRPLLLAAIGAGCISSSSILIQLADTGAATTAFFRCLLAMPPLIVLSILEQRRHGPRSLRLRLRAFGAGAPFAIDLVLWNHAIFDVGAGVATVLGNLQVMFVVIAAWVLFHERPSLRFMSALPVVGAGVVLVSGVVGGSSFGHHPVAGVMFGVSTSIAYAAFLLILRTASSTAKHIAGPLADATAGTCVFALLIGAAFGSLQFDPPWPAIGWLLALAILTQTIGWLFITSSLPQLPSAVSSLMLLLQPAAAMVLAAIILHQHPSVWQVFGAVLVCCGVLLAAWKASSGSVVTDSRSPQRPESLPT